MRAHLAECCERLHGRIDARGTMLPDGIREQLAVIEQRVAMALDLVERAGQAWGREADAAWLELMRWSNRLDLDLDHGFGLRPRASQTWVPDGWRSYGNGCL
ncbi:hypothetical protein [Streptomyces sp. URMC 124]|uniref:hypothetical protein n=1 Tax=Streptomyces sp. URMC 124 TaxID=3423405 RepID=UPI003F1A9E9E